MKRILLFFCCLSISTLIFSQNEISELFPTLAGLERTNFRYSPHDGCTSGRSNNSIAPTKIDTVINGKSYLLFNGFLLHEENDKVLVYSWVYNKDLVLYDYTLEVGDSLQLLSIDEYYHSVADYMGYKSIDENGNHYVEKIPLGKIGVKEVSTITLLDGKEHKKWTFSNGFEYVDGIGCISSGDYFELIIPLAVPSCIIENDLVCASRNGQLLYQMSESEMERLGSECKCLSAGVDTNPQSKWSEKWCDTWNIINFDGMLFDKTAETWQYELAQDTVIGNHTYSVVTRHWTADEINTLENVAAVRFTEDEKVYIFYDDSEYLLYDFNAEIRDTIEIFGGINNYSHFKTYHCVITDVKQESETNHKEISLQAYTKNEFTDFYVDTKWLEGIGAEEGFLMSPLGLGGIVGNNTYRLLCAYQKDKTIYTADWDREIGCEYNANTTVSTENVDATTPAIQKVIHNGQLYIIKDGKTYNVMGIEVEDMNWDF